MNTKSKSDSIPASRVEELPGKAEKHLEEVLFSTCFFDNGVHILYLMFINQGNSISV